MYIVCKNIHGLFESHKTCLCEISGNRNGWPNGGEFLVPALLTRVCFH